MRIHRVGRKALEVLASHDRSDWFRISNAATDDDGPTVAEVYLYDEIGFFGTPASAFMDQIRDLDTDRIDVHLNSLGGDVFDGVAIYNALRTHPAEVHTVVDSMAASIASVIAQAGDKRVMVTHSQMMVHDAWGIAVGSADDMRKYAETLEKQSDLIAEIYAERSGRTVKYYRGLMADETWMTHDEAVTHGLADTVHAPEPATVGADARIASPVAATVPPDWSAIIAGQTDQEF